MNRVTVTYSAVISNNYFSIRQWPFKNELKMKSFRHNCFLKIYRNLCQLSRQRLSKIYVNKLMQFVTKLDRTWFAIADCQSVKYVMRRTNLWLSPNKTSSSYSIFMFRDAWHFENAKGMLSIQSILITTAIDCNCWWFQVEGLLQE